MPPCHLISRGTSRRAGPSANSVPGRAPSCPALRPRRGPRLLRDRQGHPRRGPRLLRDRQGHPRPRAARAGAAPRRRHVGRPRPVRDPRAARGDPSGAAGGRRRRPLGEGRRRGRPRQAGGGRGPAPAGAEGAPLLPAYDRLLNATEPGRGPRTATSPNGSSSVIPAPDLLDDGVRISRPDERPRIPVVLLDEAVDRFLERDQRVERAASQSDGRPALWRPTGPLMRAAGNVPGGSG
jgi:hypothetical protein